MESYCCDGLETEPVEMLSKLFAAVAVGVTAVTIGAAYTQRSAFQLRQEQQPNYWPRRGTVLSGRYRNRVWVPLPLRSTYGEFRGGSPSSGK